MKLKSLIRKSLAKVPTDISGQERRFAESVSENLDVLTGRRGNDRRGGHVQRLARHRHP